MNVIITKAFKSSDKTESVNKSMQSVGALVHFFNNQMIRDKQDDIFTNLTYNDPGDETWHIDVDGYDFDISTWRELNIAIQGLFIGVSNPWCVIERR